MNNYSPVNDNEEPGRGRGARKRARTRADILAAARQVFARRGYHEASIAEITELADVGVGTFYLHFHDKDEAFRTLLDEGFHSIRDQVATAFERQSYADALPRIIHVIFRHAYAERDLFQIALTGGGQFTRSRTFHAQAELSGGLVHILEMAKSSGYLSEYNIPLLARLITGLITQGIFWWFDHDEPGPDQMAEQVLYLLWHGLPAQLFVSDQGLSSK